MSLPQTPPGGGGRRAHVHWVYIPTPKGKNWTAWIAGPCHWYTCHTKGKSKPCLHCMTGGDLTCELCSPFEVPVVIGYQPLYRECDGRPCQVVVHEYSREAIDAFKLHQPVRIMRGEGSTDSVAIMPQLGSAPRYTSRLAERLRPADLTETLLRMWSMPELTEWYRQTHGHGDNAVSLPPPPPAPPPVAKQPLVEVEVKGPLDRLREAEERRLKDEAQEAMRIGGTMDFILNKANNNGAFKKKK